MPTFGCWITSLIVLLNGSDQLMAQPGSRLFVGRYFTFELLDRRDVQSELELVDEQIKQIEKLREKFRQRSRQAFSELRDGGGQGVRERLRAALGKINQELGDELAEVLVPHQLARFRQLRLQFRLRGSLVSPLYGNEVADAIEVSAQQRQELRERGADVEREFRQRLAAIRKEAQAKMLELLTPQQRRRFHELLGEPFEFQELSVSGRTSQRPTSADPPPDDASKTDQTVRE